MVLSVENIKKSFGKHVVLEDISFEMKPSSLIGIVGENGAGKSTLLKIIVGEWKPDKGKVSVLCKYGYCPQSSLLFSQLTIEEHFQYFAAAYGLKEEFYLRQSRSLMDFFNFKKFKNTKTIHLSGGTKQKLNLAIALLHQPKLLILDEPYSGFDWDTYLKFWDYTNNLRKEGCAILIVTHLITEKDRFDKIYTINQGRLI